MTTHINRLKCAISNAPGASGALTIAAAASGFRTFGAADDGLSFDVSIVDGTAWEIRTGCVYTHSGTSLSRGTLEDSSTGSAITLTSSAVVTVTMTAGMGNQLQDVLLSGFSAYADGVNQQALTTGTGTTLIHGGSGGVLKTVEFNVGNHFTQSTGIFFPPAGLWLIGASAVYGPIASGAFVAVYLSHSTDGTTWSNEDSKAGIAWRGYSAQAGANIGGSGAIPVVANGTTDRWALRLFHNDAGTPNVPATASVRGWIKFWARKIGAAS